MHTPNSFSTHAASTHYTPHMLSKPMTNDIDSEMAIVAANYASKLNDLTQNDNRKINMSTMLASDCRDHGPTIVHTIAHHIVSKVIFLLVYFCIKFN